MWSLKYRDKQMLIIWVMINMTSIPVALFQQNKTANKSRAAINKTNNQYTSLHKT